MVSLVSWDIQEVGVEKQSFVGGPILRGGEGLLAVPCWVRGGEATGKSPGRAIQAN